MGTSLRPDDRVRHRTFAYGDGTVVVVSSNDDGAVALVRFDSRRDRPIMVPVAQLAPLADDGGEAMATHPATNHDIHQGWLDRHAAYERMPAPQLAPQLDQGEYGGGVMMNVTPAMAQAWLDGMRFPRQRPLRDKHVDFLVHEMREGRFRQSNIDIRVCGGCEYLINGQHRMHAVVRSGLTVPMMVIRTPSPSLDDVARDYATLDRPLVRTHLDGLTALGVAEATGLTTAQVAKVSSATPLLLTGFRPGLARMAGVSTQERREVALEWGRAALLACATIGESKLPRVRKMYKSPVFSVALVTFRYAPDPAERFWGRAAVNSGLVDGDPERALLDFVVERAVQSGNLGYLARAAATCWNAAYQGRQLRHVKVIDSLAPIKILGTPFVGLRHLDYDELPQEPLLR